ncbi:MAG: type IV pilus twitching motility protein PilT [bacterium]|nr:type IV pilus twitching motility protein PilT [bacterium]
MNMTELLHLTIDKGASDLHIAVGRPPMLRIDGKLVPTGFENLTPEESKRLIYSILTDAQRQKFELDKELDFSLSLHEFGRFRVNVHYQRGTVAAALRTIPMRILTLQELKLPEVIPSVLDHTSGLILVTGPTGSGKSTTLAAMIDYINEKRTDHIITIEDPIEYLHKHKNCVIEQREVAADTNSFVSALKYVLRQDPDVILIGEMRDLETIAAALTAAETGHLVLATLHTIDTAQTVDRVVDVFPPHQQQQIRTQLANVLLAVFCQRLLPMATGSGRIAAIEVMISTPAIATLIREGKTHQIPSAIETSYQKGMQTMDRALGNLLRRNLITYEEAVKYAKKPEELNRYA